MADPGRASLDADTKEFLFNMEKTAKNILKEHNKRKLLEAARAKADAVRKRAWEVRGAPLQGSRCALSAVGTRLCYGQRQSLWEQQACTGHWALGMKGGMGRRTLGGSGGGAQCRTRLSSPLTGLAVLSPGGQRQGHCCGQHVAGGHRTSRDGGGADQAPGLVPVSGWGGVTPGHDHVHRVPATAWGHGGLRFHRWGWLRGTH
jgi:hypothetical protein